MTDQRRRLLVDGLVAATVVGYAAVLVLTTIVGPVPGGVEG